MIKGYLLRGIGRYRASDYESKLDERIEDFFNDYSTDLTPPTYLQYHYP